MSARLIVSRIILYAGMILVVSVLVFAAVEVLPGDAASRILGMQATPETLAVMREKLGLNVPAQVRYLRWISGIVLRRDWGKSVASGRPVTASVLPRLRNTLILAGVVLLLYLPLSAFLGIVTAVKRGGMLDTVISTLALIGMSIPEFVTASLLIIVFAVKLGWFPATSLVYAYEGQGEPLRSLLSKMTLPVVTLLSVTVAYGLRMLRDGLGEVFESDFVRAAVLRGLPRRDVVLRHALPNCFLPLLNVWGMTAAWLIGGVVVIETVFSYPGLGRLLTDSLGVLDVTMIEAIIFILASVYSVLSLVIDVLAIMLNPRLRTG